jgi:hypothetical protein
VSAAPVTYSLRHDATPESQRHALAAVYRLILIETRASKEGGTWSALDDAMKGSKHDRAK